MDHLIRPWTMYSEVEQGALLVELSASLRRHLATLEVDQEVANAYRTFAHAARNAGHALVMKHGVPFVPNAPFPWSKLRMSELANRLPEIRDWAASTVVAPEQTLPVRHTALDLHQAGQELERHLERDRSR
jgi:hypothetical protein